MVELVVRRHSLQQYHRTPILRVTLSADSYGDKISIGVIVVLIRACTAQDDVELEADNKYM